MKPQCKKTFDPAFVKVLNHLNTNLPCCTSDVRHPWVVAGFGPNTKFQYDSNERKAIGSLLNLFKSVGLELWLFTKPSESVPNALIQISHLVSGVACAMKVEHPEVSDYTSWEKVHEQLSQYVENLLADDYAFVATYK